MHVDLCVGTYCEDGADDDRYAHDEFGYGADHRYPEYGRYGDDGLHYSGDVYDG